MIPVILRISGFLSYKEPCEVDFSRIELACISGLNGAGKSSLLDAITWVLFGEARRKDDSVINSHADTAEVSLDFDYEDLHYRVQRVRPRGKTTQLEFLILDLEEQWKPLTEATVSRTQDLIIHTLRLDYETFINASFFLQGKADQFAQQTSGERKKILSGILGLDEWETFRDITGQMIRDLEREKSAQNGIMQEITSELAEEADRREKLDHLKTSLEQAGALRQAREQAYETAGRLAAALDEQNQKVELLARQVEKTSGELSGLRVRLEGRVEEQRQFQDQISREKQIQADFDSWQAARKDLEKWDALSVQFHELDDQRSAPRLEIESSRSKLTTEQKQLQEQKKTISETQKNLPALERQLKEYGIKLAIFQGKIDERPQVEVDLSSLTEKRGNLIAENAHLNELMDDLKSRIKTLREAEGAHCPTCGKDLAGPERDGMLETLEKEGKQKGDLFRANKEQIETAAKKLEVLEKFLQEVKTAEKEKENLQVLFTRLETNASTQKELVASWFALGEKHLVEVDLMLENGDYALPAQKTLELLDSRINALGYDPDTHRIARQVELEGRQSEEEHRGLEKARASLDQLNREINLLIDQVKSLEKDLEDQQQQFVTAAEKYGQDSSSQLDLKTMENELRDLREAENRLIKDNGAAQQKIDVLAVLKKRKIEVQTQIDEISAKISRFKTLERAFSREGLPALLIEQALPDIESRANELLDRLSNGSMSIRFDTQKEYKDKKRDDKKETLDILISDAAGTREYELYSGGEAFRINFAIRLALSHLLAQRAGARLRTLVIDEGFGSQDADGRQRLVEAINLVKPDFALILVITHLEELKDSFPNHIEVEKTSKGSRVRVVAE
jgi:exonuclease SbcC